MKKLMIHFFQTMVLIAAVILVAVLPSDPQLAYMNAVIFGLVGCLLIGIGIYLVKGHKKGLFCALVFALVIGMSGTAFSGCPKLSDADKREYANQMKKYYRNFCGIENAFDVDKMLKSNLKMTSGDYQSYLDAVQYYAAWERAKAACATESASFLSLWLATDKYEDERDCAKKFMDEVAEFMEKSAEAEMETVTALLKAEQTKCWPCGIAHVLVDAMEHVCLAVEDVFRVAALQLLGIMLLFYIVIKVLILIGQFGTASNADFFTDLLKRCLLAMIAASFLYLPMAHLYQMTISPLVEVTTGITEKIAVLSGANFTGESGGGKGVGSQLMGNDSLTAATCYCCREGFHTQAENEDKAALNKLESNPNSKEWISTEISDCNGGLLGGQVNSVLTFSAKRSLMCATCAVYKQTAPLVAAGRVLVYDSTHSKTLLGKVGRWLLKVFTAGVLDKVPYPVGMWIVGMVLAICFTLLGWSIAFRLIDIFIRIGFAIIITPFLIVAYVFPISRQYTQRGWEFLVYALLNMLAISIGIAFVMAVLMSSLPNNVVRHLKIMMPASETNKYGCNLFRAWIGLAKQTKCDYATASVGGSYMPVFVIIIMTFFGMNVLKSTTVIVEALTGITCGIPSVSGAAVVGAVKAALAPFKMVAAVAAERLDRAKNPAGGSDPVGDDKKEKKGIFAKISQYTLEKAGKLESTGEGAGKGVEAAGKAMEASGKGMEAAGDAMEKGGQAAGAAMDGAGKGATKAGGGIMKAGVGLSSTGLGAIVGVPLIIAGAAVAGAGVGMQATGKAVKAGSKLAGKATKMVGKALKTTGKVQQKIGKVTQKVGKAMNKVGKVVNKGARVAAKGLRAVGRGAAKVQRGVDKLKAIPRNIANRMKKMIPAPVKKAISNIRNLPKNLKKKFLKKTRRVRAAWKYAKRKMGIHDKPKDSGGHKGGKSGSSDQPAKRSKGRDMLVKMLDKTVSGIDSFNDSAERNFGESATVGYASTDEAKSGQATDLGWKDPNTEG